jgi:hypothetical protein
MQHRMGRCEYMYINQRSTSYGAPRGRKSRGQQVQVRDGNRGTQSRSDADQLSIDHSLNERASVRDRLFFLPFGLLNDHHEPTIFSSPGASTVSVTLGADGRSGMQPHGRGWTAGADIYITPHVVLEAGDRHFAVNREFTRRDMGLGPGA